jgi:hypothetical protein
MDGKPLDTFVKDKLDGHGDLALVAAYDKLKKLRN